MRDRSQEQRVGVRTILYNVGDIISYNRSHTFCTECACMLTRRVAARTRNQKLSYSIGAQCTLIIVFSFSFSRSPSDAVGQQRQ
jgi:hypothetical protein